MSENIREIVNGTLLPQYNGKKVSITGLVTQVNPNGLAFEMNSVDNITVKVILRKPIQHALEGYVEVHGAAQGKSVNCDELIQFPESKDFDAAGHNTLCNLLHSVPNLWRTS